jgi:hypothetical protein
MRVWFALVPEQSALVETENLAWQNLTGRRDLAVSLGRSTSPAPAAPRLPAARQRVGD